jgi:hypothetical protein
MKEVASFFERWISFYWTTRCNNPQDSHPNTSSRIENLKSARKKVSEETKDVSVGVTYIYVGLSAD